MRAVVFAAIGHIDHGKTSLVAALTGVWCDRLKEEQERGMTLALGFAPLKDPSGEVEVSFVDVPGHERLIHTMLAGTGAVDKALLVVAADEGIMPQTREHVAVLQLLGISGGVVALSKCDMVNAEVLKERLREVESFLSRGPLADAPIIPVSATTGEGIPALREVILRVARSGGRRPEAFRPFRLGVDRVFSLAGAGTVVTGTAIWGKLEVGEKVTVLPSGMLARVRSLQVHNQARECVFAGERVAVALVGVKVDEVPRGAQLLGPGPWGPTERLAVDLTILPQGLDLEEEEQLWLFLLTSRVLCKVERIFPYPVQEKARAVLRLAQPLFAAPGDRVVLRRPSPAATVGGGPVLDSQPPRLRRKEAAALEELPLPWVDLGGCLERWVAQGGSSGKLLLHLAGRLGIEPEGMQATLGHLLAAKRIVVVGQGQVRLLASGEVESALATARKLLEAKGPVGMPPSQLLQELGVEKDPSLRDFYVQKLKISGLAREEGGYLVALQGEPKESPATAALEELYLKSGFAAPSLAAAATTIGLPPKAVEGMVSLLVRRGRLVRVGGKWLLHRQVLEDLVHSLMSWGRETFTVGEFKERFGLTRKLAIPILEWLDSQKVTRREEERRRLQGKALPFPGKAG